MTQNTASHGSIKPTIWDKNTQKKGKCLLHHIDFILMQLESFTKCSSFCIMFILITEL